MNREFVSRLSKTYNIEMDEINIIGDYYRYPGDVLKFKSDKQTLNLHPTQKPVALEEYFIKTYTNEGDTVLDNCCGSGTTGEACIKTNRNFILMENSKHFFDVSNNRLSPPLNLLK